MNEVLGTLRDVCEAIVDCEHKTAPTQPDGYPSIRTPNIGRGRLILDGVNRVSQETYAAWTRRMMPRAGDLILAREAPVGNVAIIPPRLKVCLGQRTVLIRAAASKVLPSYLVYLLLGDKVQGHIASVSNGATVHHLNVHDIRNLPLPRLPPLDEQRHIASILSAYDDLIENNARRIAILEEMARRIYEEWFVHFRFPGHKHIRMVESELGSVPEGWRPTSLGEVAENHDRRRKPLSKMQRQSFKGPYPYYGAAKVFDYVREYLFDGRFLLLAEDGSVETPDGFPMLQLTDGKFWANNHTHILRGTSAASTEFLFLRLEQFPIRGYITGAAQPKLTQANINRIPILVPTPVLMQQFNDAAHPLFELRANLIRANANLRITRDLLLPKLISGELDVSELPEPEAVAA